MPWAAEKSAYTQSAASQLSRRSILGRAGVEIFLNHEGYLEHDSVLKFTKVETGQLLDLLKTVHQRVAVYEQLTGRLGDVEIVLKETLDREQSLLIQALDGAALEHFLEEHLAERGRQLIDQTGDAEIIIADDRALSVEYLRNLKSGLGFLEGARQILDAGDGGTDTDNAMGVEFT